MHWRKVTLIGVGLLGGSLGLAIKRRALAAEVAGYVRRPASIEECLACGVADRVSTELAESVAGADLVVLCTPIGQMRELVGRMLPAVQPGTVITDVGSVKAPVVRDLESLVAGAGSHFVGSHPMAGAEKNGVGAAREDLFDGAVCAVTPTAVSAESAVSSLEEFWRQVGARSLRLAPELHDELVGRCSHSPHLLAALLVNTVLDPALPVEQALLCGPGFRDTTRIASSPAEMWRDICQANRDNLTRVLGEVAGELDRLRNCLERGDWPTLEGFFRLAKQRRDAWLQRVPSSSGPEPPSGPGG